MITHALTLQYLAGEENVLQQIHLLTVAHLYSTLFIIQVSYM